MICFSSFPAPSILLPVLKLFVIPVGGGIPAGVMLAQAKGVAWPVTTVLYLALAVVFEPVLLLIALSRSAGAECQDGIQG